MTEPNDARRKTAAQAARYLGAGLTWAATTGLFTWGGMMLDARWGTEPILAAAGGFAGVVAGFYYLYRQVVADTRPERRRNTDRKK